jgi:hypothetical protein
MLNDNMRKYLLLPLFIMVTSLTLNTITGTVYCGVNIDEKLSGVRITSSNDTTYSDFDGEFKIKIIDATDTLKFHIISYEDKSLNLNSNLSIY